ncbi:MAG TPA: nitrite/sulfite reductase [Planctomycetota bacterium]|jgi:ferredoxin-nitrite reductase
MASHAEDIKRVRIIPDIDALAAGSYENIPADDFDRLKWLGLYKQKQAPYFMLRIKLSGGRVSLEQLAAISRLACQFGNGIDHLSTRQDIELHDLLINYAPELLRQLAAIGLTTRGACGDTVRNIVGVPCAGVCRHEVYDVEPLRKLLYEHFLADDTVLNLPRKFKFALSGCSVHRGQYGINDVGLFPSHNAARVAAEGPGFEMWVAGGLGAQPMLAHLLTDYIPVSRVPAACAATVETHRLYGNRNSRTQARLKFVVKKWGIEKYREVWHQHFQEFLARMGEVKLDLSSARPDDWTSAIGAPFYPQRQKDRYGVECKVPLGDARAEDMLALVDFCRIHGAQVRITQGQNLHVQNLTAEACGQLKPIVEYAGWHLIEPRDPNVVACVGLYECGKAVFYTKTAAKQLTHGLHLELRDVPRGLNIHFSGCPNNCAQHSLGAIGFMGASRPAGWRKAGVYSLYLGGSMQNEGTFGKMVATGVRPESVGKLVEALVAAFRSQTQTVSDSEKDTAEHLSAWSRTLKGEQLAQILHAADCGATATISSTPHPGEE